MLSRFLILLLICLGSSGCTQFISGDFSATGSHGNDLIVAHAYRGGWCFTRMDGAGALDRICEEGDTIRYTPAAEAKRGFPPEVPEHILALFDFMTTGPVTGSPQDYSMRTGTPLMSYAPGSNR